MADPSIHVYVHDGPPPDEAAIRAERDFLLDRATAEHLRLRPGDVGVSSQALLLYALGSIRRPRVPGRSTRGHGYRTWSGDECGHDYPYDEDDLGRCERTYAVAPKHLQERMLPVLEEFRAWVLQRRNRYGEVDR